MTVVVQIFWLLFVVFHWATGISSGNLAEALNVLSYGNIMGVFAAIIFSITPVITLPALLRKTRVPLISALACNIISLIYGIAILVVEGDPSNDMALLAVAMPLVTVAASAVSLIGIAKMLKALPNQAHG